MANETNVGYASLQVIPTVRDISGNLTSQLSLPFQRAGADAGRRAGDAIASGVEGAQARVRAASDKVAKAREAETSSAAKLRIEEAKLQELRDRGITSGSRYLQQQERVRSAEVRAQNARNGTTNATNELTEAERRAAAAADELGDELENTGRRGRISGETLAKFGAMAGAGIAAAGAGLYKIGERFDDVSDTIRTSTGATGAQLAGLESIVKNVGSSVPASFEEISVTVSELTKRMGLTGPVLEQVAAQITELGNVGQSVNMGALAQSMTAFKVPAADVSKVLDELFRVSLRTGTPVQGLIDTTLKGGPALRQFGFSMGQSANLIGTLNKSGLNADKMMAGLTKSLGVFAKEGRKPGEALKESIVQIQDFIKTGNTAGATDLANKLFGVKGGVQFVEAVKAGKLSVQDLISTATGGGDTIRGAAEDTRDFAEQWELFKNKSLVTLEPIATRVFGAVGTAMEYINTTGIPALIGFGQWFDRNKVTIGIVAGVLGTVLLPSLITATVAWTASGIAATRAAAASLIASYRTIGGWVAMAAGATLNGAVIATIWTATQARAAAGWAVMQARALGAFIATSAGAAAHGARVTAVWIASSARSAAGWAALRVAALASFVATASGAAAHAARTAAVWVASNSRIAVTTGISTAAFVAQRVALVAGAAVTGAMTVAQWALNAAMSANPIGLIILAIVALVGAIVLAYKNSETFRNIVQAAWDGIKVAVGFVWNNVLKPALDGFLAALGWVGDKAMWLWQNVMIPAWDAIKNAISVVWGFIRPILDNIGRGIESLGTIASKVGDAMRNAFNGVVDVLKAPIHAVGKLLASVPTSVFGVDIPGADTIRSWGETLQSLRDGGQVSVGVGMAGRTRDGVLWGPGSGTSDSILGVDSRGVPTALVSNKEGVVTAEAMANGGAALVANLNRNGGLPGYATGGVVGEPYGLKPGTSISYGGAGFPDWVNKLGQEHGVKPSTYAGHQESDRGEAGYAPNPGRLNRGIDWSGPVPKMDAFARWLLGIAPRTEALEQIIWQNPQTGAKVGWAGRSPDTNGSYFASDYGGHQDHVHTRQSASLLAASAPAVPDTNTQVPGYVPPTYGPETAAPSTTGTTGTTTAPAPEKTRLKSFKELGSDMGGILAEGIGETFGLPDWIMDPQGYIDSNTDTGANVRTKDTTSTTPSTTTTGVTGGQAPPTTGGFAQDTPESLRKGQLAGTGPNAQNPAGLKGSALYAYQTVKAAKDMGMGVRGATIGVGTNYVEAGDPIKMWANSKVPESLKLPHDAVGSDGTSVGTFQQQNPWGPAAVRMDPYKSAELFYRALKGVAGWESMDMGAAAQAVQRSAFPDKYAKVMGKAGATVKGTGLFDNGGLWEPGTFGYNGLKEPEVVVRKHEWGVMERNAAAVEQIARQGGGGSKLADVVNIQGYTAEEIAEQWKWTQWSRTAGYGTSRNR
ncbi:tape measure protein [Gordonia phage Upyo]|nr:tape measure protein [Gordonia phage Upyo]